MASKVKVKVKPTPASTPSSTGQSSGGGYTNSKTWGQSSWDTAKSNLGGRVGGSLIGSGGNPAPVEPKFHGRESTRDPFFNPNTSALNTSLANQGVQNRARVERNNQTAIARQVDTRNFQEEKRQFNTTASLAKQRIEVEREGRERDRQLERYQTDKGASTSRYQADQNFQGNRVSSMFQFVGNLGVR